MFKLHNDSSRHFVSILGLTVMGFVQSLQAYRLHVGEPEAVHLLLTPRVEADLDVGGILEWYKRQTDYTFPVHIHPIDENVVASEAQRRTASDVYRELESRYPLAVNLVGGTNLLNCAGVMALEKTDTLFVQVTNDAAILSQAYGSELRSESKALPEPFSVADLLGVQGIPWEKSKERHSSLPDLCTQQGIAMPPNTLCNVMVGGLFWDCVWGNQNNILSFLSYQKRTKTPDDTINNKTALADARALLDFANSKTGTRGLLTRKTIILEPDKKTHERYLMESRGRIESHYLKNYGEYRLQDSIGNALRKIFTPARETSVAPSIRPETRKSLPVRKPRGEKNASSDNTSETVPAVGKDVPLLVVSAGLSDATFDAIASHQCGHVVLVYTPGDPRVKIMVDNLQKQKQHLGIKKVYLVACRHDAADLPQRLDAYARLAPQIQINSTPGTKGQGAWLTWWAKRNGADVWALDTADRERKRLVCLTDTERCLPFVPLCIQARLHAYLGTPMKSGWTPKENDPDAVFYEKMLSFLRAWSQSSRNRNALFKQTLSFEGCCLKRHEEKQWLFSWPGENADDCCRMIDHADGAWFEKLTAWALAFGVPHLTVVSQVKTKRTTDECATDIFLTELDVLAMEHNGAMYAVSCKSGRGAEASKVLAEIKAVAGTFGRYVRPMYCGLYERECTVRDEVVTFGMDTLCVPERLRKALDLAEQHGRKSAPS